jgi:hypothetical protein
LDLLEKQDLTAKSLSKKDIRNLEKLKREAMDISDLESSSPTQKAKVQISQPNDDASYISK